VGRPPWAAESKRQQTGQSSVNFKLKKNEFQGSKVFKHFRKIAKSDN